MDLLDEIEVALDLTPGRRHIKITLPRHEKTLARLLEQTGVCRHFIQSYVNDVNFCMTKGCKLIGLSGKRLLKNLGSDGKTVIENFRQVLKKLRDDIISDVIVSVETNVFRILAPMESIRKDIKDLGE